MSQLRLEQINKVYGKQHVVADVTLQVASGEIVVLLGPSGCGKTTLLRAIAGFVTPDSGRILINDREVVSDGTLVPPEKRALSMVFQHYAVWPHKTVFENLAWGLRLQKRPAAQITQRVMETLERVRMTDYHRRYPGELSGGQQQRVALARALVLEPQILLFDEPLSNLDAFLREQMRFEIRNILKTLGITSIYVTHDQTEAMALADRIAVLNQGRIEQIGTPYEIYHHSRTRFVASFIGSANLLSGRLVARRPGAVRVALPGVGMLWVSCPHNPPPEGSEVSFFIRPENILLSDKPTPQENQFSAVPLRHTFLGASTDYEIRSGEVTLRVAVTGHQTLFGRERTLYWSAAAAHCHLLDPQDGTTACRPGPFTGSKNDIPETTSFTGESV
ncbi:ABC transporter ATP-binding protein [Brenneria corticis]|uniref:Spermidine/putrescine ABC transporter ATP-binding protein n=1 Tax=Brenneria corticis TaxID=2173106 RepID=A0A2U1UCX2_9GAMM|nr:ABC transporter ATP-binding protein [Brenneria sp. CFCC 11842]PWC19519.1 spermidine/putrescine ABC transporter ATP-binding protein [Brenneria sp. CFCC 11842]